MTGRPRVPAVKRLPLLLAAILCLGVPSALAATPSEAAPDAADNGLYVEPGLSVDRSAISTAVARARNGGLRFAVVLLVDDPAGGAVSFADAVLDRIGSGTVLVLSESGEGMASDEVDRDAMQEALDRGFAAGGGDAGYVAAVVDSLVGSSGDGSSGGGSAGDSGEGGGLGFFLLILIIGGIVFGLWWMFRRQRKREDAGSERSVAEAKSEIQAQLNAMANTILDITDRVSATETSADNRYLEQASGTYAAALESYDDANDLRTLERLSDRLDEARWQLDAATALMEGKPTPPKPEPEERHSCFFDPTHADASETAQIKTNAGTKTVRVCSADAEKLRRGSQPEPRLIDVGGRRVPAPQAPRSHGGSGLDWLEVFSVLAGGAGQGASYDWGRTQSQRARPRPEPPKQKKRERAGRTRKRRRR